MSRSTHAAWSALCVVAGIGLGALTLARPAVPADPSADAFSAHRAMEHVAEIAQAPHPMGGTDIERVREYTVAELSALGLSPELQTVRVPSYYGSAGLVDVVNVMVRIPGTASSGAVVLMSHYDTEPTTPGANDNSAGVAALLEAGRALLAGEPLSNDVILLFTDGEEPAPRYGASAFVADHPWMNDVGFVVNLEAIGESGPSVLVQTGDAQAWTIERVAAGVDRPVAFSFLTATVEKLGEGLTDFDRFLAAGSQGVDVAYVRGSSIYHTPQDSVDRVSVHSVQHHGDYALGLARELGDLDLAVAPPAGRATFFTVFPGVLIHYPKAWALPLALLAVGAAAGAVWVDLRRRGSRPWPVLAVAGRTLLAALAVSLVATLVWMALTAVRSDMGATEAYVSLAALVAGGLAVRWWVVLRRQRRPEPSGLVVLWAVLALGVAVGLPGAAYIFTWPALMAAAMMSVPVRAGVVARRIQLLVVSAVTAVMVVPAIDVFLAMAQPRPGNVGSELTEAIALVALILALAAELIGRFAIATTSDGTPAA